MATNNINAAVTATPVVQRHRFAWMLSGVALRLLIAFVISALILFAFFVTSVVSH